MSDYNPTDDLPAEPPIGTVIRCAHGHIWYRGEKRIDVNWYSDEVGVTPTRWPELWHPVTVLIEGASHG